MKRLVLSFFIVAALLVPGLAEAMTAASIPTKIPSYWGTGASPGYITCPVPIPSQIGITNGRASWTDGFPPLTFQAPSSGGVPPFGQDMNGVLCQVSQWARWYNAIGGLPYDATFQSAVGGYPQGAFVASVTNSGLYWYSTVDNNTTDPDTGGAGWVSFSPFNAARSITASGAFTILATDGSIGLNRTASLAASSSTLLSSQPNGKKLTICDLANNFNAYPVTIAADVGETIRGLASATLNVNGQCATFQHFSDQSTWSYSP